MGMSVNKSNYSAVLEVFQKVYEDVVGGLNIDVTELKSTTLFVPKGTIVSINEATRRANVVKTAELQATAANDATDYRVKKNHEFKVGDFFAGAVGAKAFAITAITTSVAEYDTITLGTTLGVEHAAGVIMFQAAAQSLNNTSAYKYTAGGVVKNTIKVEKNNGVSVVTRGTVYERRLPYVVSAAMKTALTTRILFSQSY
jgi:hypothetical protein